MKDMCFFPKYVLYLTFEEFSRHILGSIKSSVVKKHPHYSGWSVCNCLWDSTVNYRTQYHASIPPLPYYDSAGCESIT